MSKILPPVLIMLLLVTAFWIRFVDSGAEAMSGDEVAMGLAAQGVLQHGYPIIDQFDEEFDRPATTSEIIPYLVAPSLKIFGYTPIGFRFHSVACGTLSILVLYLLGRWMFGGKVALLAIVLFAFAAPAIELSQWARYPAALQLFVLITVYFLYGALQADTPGVSVLFMSLCTVAFLCSFLAWQGVAFFVPGLFGVFLVIKYKNIHKNEIVALVVLAILVVVVVLTMMVRRSVITGPIMTIGSGAHLITLKKMWTYPIFDSLYYVKNFLLAKGLWMIAVPAFLTIGLVGAKREVGILWALIVSPLVMMTLLLEVRGFRYVFYLFPYVVLLASFFLIYTANKILQKSEEIWVDRVLLKGLIKANISFFFLCYLIFSNSLLFNLHPFRWEGPASWAKSFFQWIGENETVSGILKQQYKKGDKIISISPHQDFYYLNIIPEYFIQSHLQLPVRISVKSEKPVHSLTGSELIYSKHDLMKVLNENNRVWFLYNVGFAKKLLGKGNLEYIRSTMRKVGESQGFELYLWDH